MEHNNIGACLKSEEGQRLFLLEAEVTTTLKPGAGAEIGSRSHRRRCGGCVVGVWPHFHYLYNVGTCMYVGISTPKVGSGISAGCAWLSPLHQVSQKKPDHRNHGKQPSSISLCCHNRLWEGRQKGATREVMGLCIKLGSYGPVNEVQSRSLVIDQFSPPNIEKSGQNGH